MFENFGVSSRMNSLENEEVRREARIERELANRVYQ